MLSVAKWCSRRVTLLPAVLHPPGRTAVFRLESTSANAGSDATRSAILRASLQHIPKFGWSVDALKAGARGVGLELDEELFPGKELDLLEYLELKCNGDLVDYMRDLRNTDENTKSGSKLVRAALEHRLRKLIPYINQWPQAMAMKACPSAASSSVTRLAMMVDDIWYWAGDRSTDFNWYTKRALLAGIYSLTELNMIQDNSHDFKETWGFLDRRMEDIAAFARYRGQLTTMLNSTAEIASAGFTALRNAAGYNFWRW